MSAGMVEESRKCLEKVGCERNFFVSFQSVCVVSICDVHMHCVCCMCVFVHVCVCVCMCMCVCVY